MTHEHVPGWRGRLEAAAPTVVERCARRIMALPLPRDPLEVRRILREECGTLLGEAGLATQADADREDALDYAAALAMAELDRLTRG